MNAAILGVTLVVSAPALKDRPKTRDLMGEWVVESMTVSGTARKPADGLVYEFTKDGLWVIRQPGREGISPNRRYTTDATARPPRVELTADATRPDITRREGIYKVEGDTATLCVAPARQPRPTAFESTAEDRNTIYVLKRKKKE